MYHLSGIWLRNFSNGFLLSVTLFRCRTLWQFRNINWWPYKLLGTKVIDSYRPSCFGVLLAFVPRQLSLKDNHTVYVFRACYVNGIAMPFVTSRVPSFFYIHPKEHTSNTQCELAHSGCQTQILENLRTMMANYD